MAEDENGQRPVFKTIESFEKPYGTRNFIEVALKETNDGENVFFSISKGFTGQNDVKRYKKSLGFAASEELQTFLLEAFTKLLKTYQKLPKKAAAAAKEETTEKKPATKKAAKAEKTE